MHVNIDDLELFDGWSETDPTRRARFLFALWGETGARSTSAVYFEIDPGEHLGVHTDSAEEILFVIGGSPRTVLGADAVQLRAGDLTLVPAMVPHDIVNDSGETARLVGFFSSSTPVSTFHDPVAPFGRRVLGAPLPDEEAAAREAAAASSS